VCGSTTSFLRGVDIGDARALCAQTRYLTLGYCALLLNNAYCKQGVIVVYGPMYECIVVCIYKCVSKL
jgi:hypothetical protein